MQQRSKEWFQARCGKFTASMIHTLYVQPRTKADKDAGKFGATAMTYIKKKAIETVTGIPERPVFSKQMEHGTEWEPIAAIRFDEIMGFKSKEAPFFEFSDYSGATPDRIIDRNTIIEIKCPYTDDNHFDFLSMVTAQDLYEIEKKYFYQVHHQILCSGAEKCYFVTYSPFTYPYNLGFIEIYRDNDILNEMHETLKRANNERLNLVKQYKKIKAFADPGGAMAKGEYYEIMEYAEEEGMI